MLTGAILSTHFIQGQIIFLINRTVAIYRSLADANATIGQTQLGPESLAETSTSGMRTVVSRSRAISTDGSTIYSRRYCIPVLRGDTLHEGLITFCNGANCNN